MGKRVYSFEGVRVFVFAYCLHVSKEFGVRESGNLLGRGFTI